MSGPGSTDALRVEIDALRVKTKYKHKKTTSPSESTRSKVIPSIASNNGIVTMPIDNLIQMLLRVNHGVFFGDSHGDFNCSEFLVSKMVLFKKQGVTLFFMEMFGSDAQPMLDRYFKYGDNEKDLVLYLDKGGWEKSTGMAKKYVEIVKAARQQGIKVIGLDDDSEGASRLEDSNLHWTKVVNQYASKGKKYVVFAGFGHSSVFPLNKGIDFRLGIPSMDFETGSAKVFLGDGKYNNFRIVLEKSPHQPAS